MTNTSKRKRFGNGNLRLPLACRAAPLAALVAALPWQGALADEAPAHDLGKVVFSANRTPTEDAAVGSTVTVIGRKEIERSGETTVLDLLARVPGLGFSQAGPAGSTTTMQMRGLGARYVLVRVDGIDVSDPTQPQAGSSIENLLLGDVERIEVLRGSQSALYGGTAVAGVIDITTRTADEKGVHHTVNVGGGSYGTKSVRYGVSAATDALEMGASFQRFQTSGFSSAERDNGNTEVDGYGNSTASVNASYRANEALRLFAAARYTYRRSNYDDFSYDWMTGFGRPVDETGALRFHTIGREVGARVGADFNLLDGRLKNTIAVQHYDLTREVYDSSPGRYDGRRTKIEYLGNLALTETIGLSAGLDYTTEDARTTGGVDSGMNNAGVFAQGSWKPITDVTLTAALRDDHHSSWGDHPTGRVTAAWEATRSTKLRTSWGTGFRPPSLYELHAPTYGNANLKPEESRSFDIGIDQQVWDNRARLSLTYFNIDTDNLISYDTSTWAYTQIEGTSNSQGVEFTGRLKLLDNLTLDAGYTFTEAVDANDSRLMRVPRHKVTTGATLKANDRTTLTLRGTWVGDSIDTDYSVGQIRQLPNYFLLDAGLTWDWTDNVSLSLTGKNLLDEKYQTIWGYGTTGRAVYAELKARY